MWDTVMMQIRGQSDVLYFLWRCCFRALLSRRPCGIQLNQQWRWVTWKKVDCFVPLYRCTMPAELIAKSHFNLRSHMTHVWVELNSDTCVDSCHQYSRGHDLVVVKNQETWFSCPQTADVSFYDFIFVGVCWPWTSKIELLHISAACHHLRR